MDRSPTGEVEVTGGIWKHTYLGNWKLQLEGSNEGYHPDYLHKIGRLVAERVQLQAGRPGSPQMRPTYLRRPRRLRHLNESQRRHRPRQRPQRHGLRRAAFNKNCLQGPERRSTSRH